MGLRAVAASSGGITVGTTTISGGTDTRVLYQDGTTIGETTGFTFVKGTGALSIPGQLSASGGYLFRGGANFVIIESPQGQVISGTIAELDISPPRVAIGNTSGIPAGGATTSAVSFTTAANNFGIYWGSGAPSVVAAQGSIYLRSDATGATSRLYVQGAAATAASWVNVTMAA